MPAELNHYATEYNYGITVCECDTKFSNLFLLSHYLSNYTKIQRITEININWPIISQVIGYYTS